MIRRRTAVTAFAALGLAATVLAGCSSTASMPARVPAMVPLMPSGANSSVPRTP